MTEKEMMEEYERLFNVIPLDKLLKSAMEKLIEDEYYMGFFIPIKNDKDDER